MGKGLMSFDYAMLAEILKLPEGMDLVEVHTDSFNKVVNIIVEHPEIEERTEGRKLLAVAPIYKKENVLVLVEVKLIDPELSSNPVPIDDAVLEAELVED